MLDDLPAGPGDLLVGRPISAGDTRSPSMTSVLSKVRSWSMNWPRSVNPAGTDVGRPPPRIIASAIFSWFRSLS